MFKRNTKTPTNEQRKDGLQTPKRSRIAFIQFNDGMRIGQSRQKSHNINLLQSRYDMTPEGAKQLANDIERAFLSGAITSR